MIHRKIAVALAVFGLAAGGTAFGATRVDAPNPLNEMDLLSSSAPAELSSDQQSVLTSDIVDHYGLDLSNARVASDETSGISARGASSLSGTWIVVPGSEGVCLVPGDRSVTCGPLAEFEDGQLAMTTLPSNIGERYIPGKAPTIGAGAGKVQGVVPDGITRVVGVAKSGEQIASTSVVNNVYELDVASFRDLGEVRLVRADGSATALPLGLY
jgi:hypothetical protein